MPSGTDLSAFGALLSAFTPIAGGPPNRGKMASSTLGPILPAQLPQQIEHLFPDPFWPFLSPLPTPEPATRGGYSEHPSLGHICGRVSLQRKMKALLADEGSRGWVGRNRKAHSPGPLSSFPARPRLCCVTFDKSCPLLILSFLIWKMEVIP